jgi:excisionase family DNA binding protein
MGNLITRAELAKYLRVSLSTVYRGMKNGTWPFCAYIVIGHRIRYPMTILTEIHDRVNKTSSERNCC